MNTLLPLPDYSLHHDDYDAWRDQIIDVREDLIGRFATILTENQDPQACLEAIEPIIEFYNPGEEVERDGTLTETRVKATDDGQLIFEKFVAHDKEDDVLDWVSITYHPDKNTWWYTDADLPDDERKWGESAHEHIGYRAVAQFPWGDESQN